LLARGGDGGHGGDGGDGADGYDGYDGSDATCSSRGTDGGDGDPGGDGGNATSGSNGGDGGDVTVRLVGEDTHLLLLLGHDVQAGVGGSAGSNGRGGRGGSGGSGGASHSAHGSESNRCSGNSGGSSGSSGASGSSGSASVHAGANGEHGVWTIVVDGVDYPSRYRLRLTGFEFRSDDADGVIEPDELVRVQRLAALNEGHVPSPPPELHETRLYLPLTRNVGEPTAPILLPLSLVKDAATVVPGELLFRVPDVDTAQVLVPNQRYRDEGLIDPRAHLADARRDHPEFPNAQPFVIGFPAGTRSMRLPGSVGAGESHRFQLQVENLSERALGAEADDPIRRRGLQAVFRFEGRTLPVKDVRFRAEGRPVDLAGGPFRWDVPHLAPGELASLDVELALAPEAAAYGSGHLSLDLELGVKGAASDRRRVVERRRLRVGVAAQWQAPTKPSLVLVTNVGVEREVVAAWRALAADLGLGVAIWDVSYYGFLPFVAPVADRSDARLQEAARDQVLVVLDNSFPSPLEDDEGRRKLAQASSFLAPDEVVAAGREAGLGVLLVRSPPSEELKAQTGGFGSGLNANSASWLTTPTFPPEHQDDLGAAQVVEHASTAELFAWLEDNTGEGDRQADGGVLHRVDASADWFWGKPYEWDLEELGTALSEALGERWPGRTYHVTARFDPRHYDGVLWNTIDYGEFLVRRGPDVGQGPVTQLTLAPEEANDGRALMTAEFLEALLRSFSFPRRLELLTAFLDGDLPRARPGDGEASPSVEALGLALSNAILADLVEELDRWTEASWSGLSASGTYRERLTCHAALARLTLQAPLERDGPRGVWARAIVEGVEARAAEAWGFWDVVVPFHARRYYVAAAAAGTCGGDGLIDDFAAAVFGAHVGPEVADLDEQALERGDDVVEAVVYPEGRWDLQAGVGVSRFSHVRFSDATSAGFFSSDAARRREARAGFLEALEKLHAETFQPELLDAEDPPAGAEPADDGG
jgi:hypothetical protein